MGRFWLRLGTTVSAFFRFADEISLVLIGMVLFVVASNTQTGWVYLLSGTVFGALFSAAWLSRRAMRGQGFRLWLPESVQRGQEFTVTLDYQCGAQGYPAFWAPQPETGFRLNQQGRSLAQLPAGAGQVAFRLLAQSRGVFDRLPGKLVCYGPLAWFPSSRFVAPELTTQLVVLPPVLRLSEQRLVHFAGGQGGQFRGRPASQGDLRRLREYQVGDDVRWIHWPSSAKSGQLVVREFSQGGAFELVLYWGVSPEAVEVAGSSEAFEWMLSWVHTFFQRARQLGWRVRLAYAGNDGGWAESLEPQPLALARRVASPSPPVHPAESPAARIDFWLGSYPGSHVVAFEFWPQDFVDGAGPVTVPGRVGPGQEPQ